MKAIPNVYDGPHTPVKKMESPSFSLDFAHSDNAAVIDSGIRDTIKGIRYSMIAMGIGLAKIKAKGLYVDLRFHSMNDYLESLCDDMQIDRSTAHNWLYIGEAWTKYRRELEKIEFSDEDGPTKLPYVDRALEKHEKREVFKKVKELSLRAFKEFAKGETPKKNLSKIKVVGNKIFVGKKLAVTLAKELDPKSRAFLTDIVVKAGEALQAGEVLYTTRLYDFDELKRFKRGADRLKDEMRAKR